MNEQALSLTVVCIFVVFSALLILMVLYKILGWFFTHPGFWTTVKKPAKKVVTVAKAVKSSPEPATVVEDEDVVAAIALALQMYESENMHDNESYALTIDATASAWGNHTRSFRKRPRVGSK